jgi:high-affinity iron transporter
MECYQLPAIINNYNSHVISMTFVNPKMPLSLYHKGNLIIQAKADLLPACKEWMLMIPGFLLALREGIEAVLIVGIVLGALRKTQREELKAAVWWGTVSAIVVSLVAAIVLYRVGVSFEGKAEEAFEGITMLLAAGVLTWMIFWMRFQSRNISTNLEADVRQAARQRSRRALFLLAFLAVVREGIELALFLTATSFASGAQQTVVGALLGLGAVTLLAWALFSSLIKLNIRRFFQVTSILLVLFAAGLVAHGVHELNEIGWIPTIIEHVWDINGIINEKSFGGEILKTLFGYNGNPSLTEIIAYAVYFLMLFLGLQRQQARIGAPQQAS